MDTATEEIISRFNKSWVATEASFEDLINNYPGFDILIPVYRLIQKLKQAGAYKFFRLSVSMQDLIFSRSYEPALRPGQKYIVLKAKDNCFTVTLKDAAKMYKQYTIKDLEDERFTDLLQTLKEIPID
jgi:hypothetical protein